MKNRYIIPIFVPHKGCPNQCIFCNQKKISGQIKEITSKDVKDIIQNYINFNKKAKYKDIEIAFYGGSFTAIEKEKQIELLEVAYEYIREKRVGSIRLSTRPDCITKDILTYLKKYGVKTIELGVQSMNDVVLNASLRGHTVEDVVRASKLIKKYGFNLGLQMMVGLPKSTEQLEIETANKFIKLKPKFVRIYPVLVIKDTPLEEEYLNKKYEPYSLEKAIEVTSKLLIIFKKNRINVIRMGLQTTDNINEGKDVVAGPFHPAFGELVQQRIILDEIEKYINMKKTVSKLEIICNNKMVSKIIGNKKKNINEIKEKYNILVEIKINNRLKDNKYKISKKE